MTVEKQKETRVQVNLRNGLNQKQVAERMQAHLYNEQLKQTTKSYQQIIKDNVFTLFNFINAILAAAIIFVQSYKNLLFLGVIISNIAIGIFQEIRAKRVLDRLSLMAAPSATVIRDGVQQEIDIEEVVLDDIMVLQSGDQICSDAIIKEGRLEVNESLLSGESDVVIKSCGDLLYSGSFVTSGKAITQVAHVGKHNYIYEIIKEAKTLKRHKSQLRDSINVILKLIGFIIIPLGVLLFLKHCWIASYSFTESVVSTVAALVGMIPEGLVLLTSVALAVGSINLAKRKTLVQELYCIETLARVDTLCLDKTGTITKGMMQVEDVITLSNDLPIKTILAACNHALQDDNATAQALKQYAGCESDWKSEVLLPFSSVRKYSGVTFQEYGTYYIGAYEFLFAQKDPAVIKQLEQYAKQGIRVIVLAHCQESIEEDKPPHDLKLLAYLLLSDPIRAEASETLLYFEKQGVDIKIISGDHPATVHAIAQKAGVLHCDAYVDASTLSDDQLSDAVKKYAVFGRVSPKQKQLMVRLLKEQGHTVAMSGDGVNDVMALKEADCSIAVASGSDAAKNIANLVLLDNNFANMPQIVLEGRRVINNIQRAASLFLVKTTFSTILSILVLFLDTRYPFMPIQLTLISTLTIGMPSFFLALEPNYERVKGNFIMNVLGRALPGALSVITYMIAVNIICSILGYRDEIASTMVVLLTGASGLNVLLRVCNPFTWTRKLLFFSMCFGFIAAVVLVPGLFSLVELPTVALLFVLGGTLTIPFYTALLSSVLSRMQKAKHIVETMMKKEDAKD